MILVACVSKKSAWSDVAGSLYQSVWFTKARAYAEASHQDWLILSARYGLISPSTWISPYDETLNKMPAASRRRWARFVLQQAPMMLRKEHNIEILAGVRYREHLVEPLRDLGYNVTVPMKGLGIGQQMAWLTARC